MIDFHSKNIGHTLSLSNEFSKCLKPGDTVGFLGGLGAGKTTFISGLMNALHFDKQVTSPTFTLAHEYQADLKVYHLDCFRVRNSYDWISLGIEQYITNDAVLLVEWTENIKSYFDQWYWRIAINFDKTDENARIIQLNCTNTKNLSALKQQLKNRC